jgi:hypothetical protein
METYGDIFNYLDGPVSAVVAFVCPATGRRREGERERE